MSLYNMVNGFNPACIFLMPMLGRKQDEYPRFRDCFLSDHHTILIYTRVGGNNRHQGYGEEELMKDPNFITTFDDPDDSTYGYYEFNPPEQWKSDFALLEENKFTEVSDEYVQLCKNFWPKLNAMGTFEHLFRPEEAENVD